MSGHARKCGSKELRPCDCARPMSAFCFDVIRSKNLIEPKLLIDSDRNHAMESVAATPQHCHRLRHLRFSSMHLDASFACARNLKTETFLVVFGGIVSTDNALANRIARVDDLKSIPMSTNRLRCQTESRSHSLASQAAVLPLLITSKSKLIAFGAMPNCKFIIFSIFCIPLSAHRPIQCQLQPNQSVS